MTQSNSFVNGRHYTLTIQPGFADFEEPIRHYVKRANFGPNMTVYTIDDENMALSSKKRIENNGYIVHMEYPNGNTTNTNHDVIHAGIKISSN